MRAAEVGARLAERIESLCAELLPAGVRDGRYWAAGSVAGEPGQSLRVNLSGAHRGCWTDWANPTDRGDALDLIRLVVCGGDMPRALNWAKSWLGAAPVTVARPKIKQRTHDSADDAARTSAAREIWLSSRKAGPIATAYLSPRGLPPPYPACIREHPALWCREARQCLPAVIYGAQDVVGRFRAIQRVYLTPDAKKKAILKAPKLTLGPIRGAAVRLGEAAEEISLCKAPEEGLAIQQLYGDRAVWCSLGESHIGKVDLPPIVRRVVLYADNDGPGRDMAQRASRALAARDVPVWLVFPEEVKDFNALLLSRTSELAA